MKRKLSAILAIGMVASTIPAAALANPGNPYWQRERSEVPAPFSREAARIQGGSPDRSAVKQWSADRPVGTGAMPSDEERAEPSGVRTWRTR